MSRISVVSKRRYLDDSGYQLLAYSGRLKDAPPQVRHILRDFPQGFYVIHVGLKAVHPLPVPPASQTPGVQNDWLASEAFYAVLASALGKRGWLFMAKSGGDITSLDLRPKPTWNAEPLKNELWADKHAEGFYASDGVRLIGAYATENEVIEEAAIADGLLDGYYTDQPEVITRPFTGRLRPVNVAENVYGLMTDDNTMLATLYKNPTLGDDKATARMMSLAPEMLMLVERLVAHKGAGDLADAVDTAHKIHQLIFDPYTPSL